MIGINEFFHFRGTPIGWREILDIILVSYTYYRLILLLRGTRAVPVLYGLAAVAVVYWIAGEIGLTTLHWLLQAFLGSIFLVAIILFQADIRKGLMEVGTGRFWRRQRELHEDTVEALVRALVSMARQRIGALLVMEKTVPLGDVLERGVTLNADISKELVMTIFHPDTPLHDGAMVIRNNRIVAAGCILPLSTDPKIASLYGTRHRAAIGICEETDALALVVSEERGVISVVIGGKLVTNLDEVRLRRVIRNAWGK